MGGGAEKESERENPMQTPTPLSAWIPVWGLLSWLKTTVLGA